MYRKPLVVLAFSVAMLSLAINLIRGSDLLHSALMASGVFFAVTVILLLLLRGVFYVLARFLRYQKEMNARGRVEG